MALWWCWWWCHLVAVVIGTATALPSRKSTPPVVVMHETCGGSGQMSWLPPNVTVLQLPCNTATLPPLPSPPYALVVVASCEGIRLVTLSLARNTTTSASPVLLPLPIETTMCPGAVAEGSCAILVHPVKRIVDLMLSWMVYHSWTALIFLHDTDMGASVQTTLVKHVAEGSARLGARVAFKEVSGGGGGDGVEVVVAGVVEGWRDTGRRRLVVVATDATVAAILDMVPKLVVGEGDSECEWLIFTSIHSSITATFLPTNGHRVYFVNNPLFMDVQERGEDALRTAEILTKSSVWCPHALKVPLPSIEIYVKRQDYSSSLSPKVEVAESDPRLVPAYVYYPTAPATNRRGRSMGRLRALSVRPQYQLNGAHLLVATVRGEPFVKVITEADKKTARLHKGPTTSPPPQLPPQPRKLPQRINCPQPVSYVGFLIDMLQVLAAEMNFTYTIYEVCDGSYGSEVRGRWSGVVGDVLYGHAHVGLANLGANYARTQVVAFPRVATSYGGAGIILKRPATSVQDLLVVYLLPFSLSVWLCILITIPVASIAMAIATCPRSTLRRILDTSYWIQDGARSSPVRIMVTSPNLTTIDRLEPVSLPARLCFQKQILVENQVDDDDEPQSFFRGLWFASTVLMQQGQEWVPRSGVGRMVFGIMWIAAVVLYAAYTSNLVSHFTVTKQTLPVNNLEELARSDYYKFGTRTGSVYIDNMKTSPSEVHQRAWRRLEKFGNGVMMTDYEEAINATLKGSYAFIGDHVVLDYYQRKDCDLVLLKQQLFPSISSFVLPLNSPLLPALNHYLSVLSETGILEKLRQRWWSAQPCPDAATITAYKSIELWEVVSALLLMGMGMLAALLVCCCERVRPPTTTAPHPRNR